MLLMVGSECKVFWFQRQRNTWHLTFNNCYLQYQLFVLFLDNKKSCTFKQKPIKIKRHCGISLGMLINNINHNWKYSKQICSWKTQPFVIIIRSKDNGKVTYCIVFIIACLFFFRKSKTTSVEIGNQNIAFF
jgi:hypothetical protein